MRLETKLHWNTVCMAILSTATSDVLTAGIDMQTIVVKYGHVSGPGME